LQSTAKQKVGSATAVDRNLRTPDQQNAQNCLNGRGQLLMADPATACPAVDCKRAVNFPIATAFRDAHQMMAQLTGSP
jgi:hypothetical protein